MASERPLNNSLPPPSQTLRHISPPPPQVRQRGLARAATSSDVRTPLNHRRSSLFSDGISETHRSLRSSTEDLLHPRVTGVSPFSGQHEPSHWHSVPLGLALLPAVGGLFFQNGSAVVTDVTLLVLAAIFLNWSVRLPWDWYLSAQATTSEDPNSLDTFDAIAEESGEDDAQDEAIVSSEDNPPPIKTKDELKDSVPTAPPHALAAKWELQLHELLALFACFLFPAIGAWLLHAIRSQLSRPSEGLVSNYNLIIFLLASEIRPTSHLIKMIQARTLHLQRVVGSSVAEENKFDSSKILDISRRLEELEAHVADSAENAHRNSEGPSEQLAAKTVAQATSDMRKTIQPELDALNRAVRRYEKRTTISAIQTESRLQDLESRLKDVVVLAAAAQRNAESQPRNFIIILVNWLCGVIVVPLQLVGYLLSLPSRAMNWVSAALGGLLGSKKSKVLKESKAGRAGSTARLRERKLKV